MNKLIVALVVATMSLVDIQSVQGMNHIQNGRKSLKLKTFYTATPVEAYKQFMVSTELPEVLAFVPHTQNRQKNLRQKTLYTVITAETHRQPIVSTNFSKIMTFINNAPDGQRDLRLKAFYAVLAAETRRKSIAKNGSPGVMSLSISEMLDVCYGIENVRETAVKKNIKVAELSDRQFEKAYLEGLPTLPRQDNETVTAQFLREEWRKSAYFAVNLNDPATLTMGQIIGGLKHVQNLLDSVKTCAAFLLRHSGDDNIRSLVETMPEECERRFCLLGENEWKVKNGITGVDLEKISKWMLIERYKMKKVSNSLFLAALKLAQSNQKKWGFNSKVREEFNKWQMESNGYTPMPSVVKKLLNR